ncbi:cation:proton antiporter [Candidatus Omnitrophota bacterium]
MPVPVGESILNSAEFQMSLLMFVALAGYLIAYRINQSAVVGIILAGILVGPSLLGLITYTDFVSSLAHLGAVVLLFTIGLEFDIKEITRAKYLLVAFLGIIVPWIAGFYLAKLFGYDFGAAVFIGTALTATSIAITANVLREMGKLQTDVGKAIIGAAIIDDVLALLALSLSEGIVSGTFSLSTLLITVAKAIGFLAIGGLLGKILIARIMIRIDKTRVAMKYPESIFIFAIMVAFLYAMVAEVVGLSAIIGSFLAGVTLAGINLKRGDIFREGAEHLQIIFASIFFVSLGILMDVHALTLQLLLFVLVLTVVAAFTKIIGCGVPAKLQGINMKDSLTIGIGMMPRGEVAMIIALIGLNRGLILQDTYAALILMSLLTTIIPPIIMRNWLFKQKGS